MEGDERGDEIWTIGDIINVLALYDLTVPSDAWALFFIATVLLVR